jgi:hypothetical protein
MTMLLQPTIERLREQRLLGMAAALEEQSVTPDIRSLSFEDRFGSADRARADLPRESLSHTAAAARQAARPRRRWSSGRAATVVTIWYM